MDIKNRNLFRITRFVLLSLPKLLRFFARFRKPAKRLLIIKTDAIGDYILFRNFIEVTMRSEKYKHYRIDLLGNKLWQDVTLKYDKQFLHETYFIAPNSFYEAPLKTFKLGWRLFLNNYEVVLQPTYTRVFITDGLAALTAAKQIFGYQSDNEGIVPRYKNQTDKFYTQKLSLPQGVYFEFNRNRFFFETILDTTLAIKQPFVEHQGKNKKGIAILPGAGAFKRGWEKEKFLELIKLLLYHTKQPIYLIGGPGEVENGDYLMQNLPGGRIGSFINKTSLPQMIEIIGNSTLLIANETSAIHMAVATQVPSVCILGGGHFERFAPYPDEVDCKPVCVYEKLPCYYCNWLCIFKTEEQEPFPCISNLNIDNVWQATRQFLPA
ncbi:glycosyltransferase family 9 protein [Mucilaginibacter sp.]|uniref:glycosyltransferase family 9 protein n=1 Tax=Mucilaginibacter sp. TaxID=1882438 RepID=UPI0026108051|nr:glycosyltransferase family 9 protein [Mucilaginibacter sp.]MDB5128624.1 lipopolysaccharide core biosynthesis protein [Mucilaginibacter sp.]